jgi:hypothetical protein
MVQREPEHPYTSATNTGLQPYLDQVVSVQQLAPQSHNDAAARLAVAAQQLQDGPQLTAGQALHLLQARSAQCCVVYSCVVLFQPPAWEVIHGQDVGIGAAQLCQ